MTRHANQLDLARAAGVSVSTVSRALSNSRGISDELRSQIHQLAKDLNYKGRGSQGPATRQLLAYVAVSSITGGLASFYHAVMDGLTVAAASAGLEIEVRLIEKSTLDVARLDRDVDRTVPDLTMLVGVDADDAVFDRFGRDRPLLLVNTFDPQMRFDCVAPNNFYGAFLATRKLLEAGHRTLLHVRDQLRWTTLQRHQGFLAAIATVPGASGAVLDIHDNGEAAIADALRQRAAAKHGWTGVFCVHDMAAIRVVHALEEAGYVLPRDVSIVGFDDLPAASMVTPRLSTIAVDCAHLGREAIALAARRLADPDAGVVQVECAVHWVTGQSILQISW